MAYREFEYEKQYAAPDTSHFLDESTRAVSNIFQQLHRRNEERLKSANQFEYDLSKGQFENDQKILTEFANHVVGRGKQEILRTGKIDNETANLMTQGKGFQQMSTLQHQKAKDMQSEIIARDAKDPYYDGSVDLAKLKDAANGKDNEVNFFTRGQRLVDAEKQMGDIDSFKYANYRADYVKKIGEKSREVTTGNPNATKTKFDQGTFWDDSKGKLGVTDKHAIDYINSDPQGRVDQYFSKKLNDQLDQEIEKMQASGDSRVSWMKGMNKADIKNELINNPSKNLINSQDYGVRKRELAKQDLAEADRINSKVSVDYKADKGENSKMYRNDNVAHSYSFNNSKTQAAVPGQTVSPYDNPGPGGVLLQKNGKPLLFNSTNPIRTNINTGTTNKSKIGSVPFNMTGYQLQAFSSSGAPVLLHGNTPDEMVNFIKTMPLDWFDPNGKYKLQPDMKVALQGYTVNQAHILNAANNSEQSIQSSIAKAQNENNSDELAAQEEKLKNLQVLKSLIGSGADDQELALAASRAGINGVQVNEIVQASDADMANIKAVTQGFDLRDKNYWNADMHKVDEAYKQRYNEAVASGFKSAPQKTPRKNSKSASQLQTVTSQEQYNALPSGSVYLDPNGVKRKKK